MQTDMVSSKAAFMLIWAETLSEMHAGPGLLYVVGLLSQKKITLEWRCRNLGFLPKVTLTNFVNQLIDCVAFPKEGFAVLYADCLFRLDIKQLSMEKHKGPCLSMHEASPWPADNITLYLEHLLLFDIVYLGIIYVLFSRFYKVRFAPPSGVTAAVIFSHISFLFVKGVLVAHDIVGIPYPGDSNLTAY